VTASATSGFVQTGERPQHPLRKPPFQQWDFPDGTPWASFYRQDSGYLLRFLALADFEVSPDGQRVQGWGVPGVAGTVVEHLYLNQVLPLALSRQGRLVLHGSAVEIGGRCVAFLGASGRGKSTLAAEFARAGSRFLTDDGLQLDWQQGSLRVLPGHPSIRLWSDSRRALDGAPHDADRLRSEMTKVRLRAGASLPFCPEPRPLRAVHVLGPGSAARTTVDPMKPSDSLVELVRHSFLLDIQQHDMLARHFDELSRMANLPIFFRLDYPRRFDDLPAVRDVIAQHSAGLMT